jgi:hypothetical protein
MSILKYLFGYGIFGGMVLMLGGVMVMELGIALHLAVAQNFVAKGMQLGESMWAIVAITMVYGTFSAKVKRREPLWLAIIICLITSSFAICSQLTAQGKTLMTISEWANVFISFVFFGSMLLGLKETIREQHSKSHPA